MPLTLLAGTLGAAALGLMGPSSPAAATEPLLKIGDSLVDAKAMTLPKGSPYGLAINGKSFQQDPLVSLHGFQYVGYYDADGRVSLGRRKLPAGPWSIIRFADYSFKKNDAHNTVCVGICPRDGTIHLAFDHHISPLHYRVSRPNVATHPELAPWSASLFGPIHSDLEQGKPLTITYPRFWPTPEGGLQLSYRRGRSGNGDMMLVDYDPQTGRWSESRQVDSGDSTFQDKLGQSPHRCSYPNGYDYGPDGRLHATLVWREISHGANHDLIYLYSDDHGKTWRNNRGDLLDRPAGVHTPGIIVAAIPRGLGVMNNQAQAVDSKGRVHVVMYHCTDQTLKAADSKEGQYRLGLGPRSARRYHHYWRDVDGTWHHTEMPWVAGNRPKVLMDKNDNAWLIYNLMRTGEQEADGGTVDNGSYFAVGDLQIAMATAASKWTDWHVVHTEKGPFMNEMLADRHRWRQAEILSIMAQQTPLKPGQPSPLRVLDFQVTPQK